MKQYCVFLKKRIIEKQQNYVFLLDYYFFNHVPWKSGESAEPQIIYHSSCTTALDCKHCVQNLQACCRLTDVVLQHFYIKKLILSSMRLFEHQHHSLLFLLSHPSSSTLLYFPFSFGQSYLAGYYPGVLLLCLPRSILETSPETSHFLTNDQYSSLVFFSRFLLISPWPSFLETTGLRSPA